jgi:hypothetical protein
MKIQKTLNASLIFLVLFFIISFPLFAQDTVLSLKERIIDIQNNSKLGFRNFTLCTNIITYGQYVASPNNKLKAGSTALFYYEPENVFTNRRSGIYHVWYTQSIIVRDSKGEEIFKSEELLNFNHQSQSPVLDLYAKNSLNLGKIPPGKYEYEAILHDKLRGTSAGKTFAFEVVP